ncbi:VLRF1 family aeRF1-type release factor [Streptosporangium sp. NPDC001559]|uniref:VLRF1 family aeRF1-type release factor n=1 Tax=Streptosporangium sp. NPDC001559 TaxID=3366187 RepID=UPI0036E3BE4C
MEFERFGRAALREVVSMHDELGVLSFYVTASPQEEAAVKPAWRIRFGNELSELREQMTAVRDRERRTALLNRLDELETDFEQLLDPTESGLGRVMFAPVGDGRARSFSFQVPVADQIVMESTAYVRPLVNAVEAAPPAGFVVLSRDGLKMIDYRYGLTEELGGTSFEIPVEEWKQMRGPATAELARSAATHRDKFERRVEENLTRQLRAAAPGVAEEARRRGWQTVVLLGDVQLTEIVAPLVGGDVLQVDAVVDSLPPAKLAEYVEPQLRAARTRHGVELTERARDAALSGGPGALGLEATLGALNDSRVAQLLLDESAEWDGGRTEDGRLYARRDVPQGQSGEEVVPDPTMGERMIERALDIDAEVIVLDGEAAQDLAESGGVAAILRW